MGYTSGRKKEQSIVRPFGNGFWETGFWKKKARRQAVESTVWMQTNVFILLSGEQCPWAKLDSHYSCTRRRCAAAHCDRNVAQFCFFSSVVSLCLTRCHFRCFGCSCQLMSCLVLGSVSVIDIRVCFSQRYRLLLWDLSRCPLYLLVFPTAVQITVQNGSQPVSTTTDDDLFH